MRNWIILPFMIFALTFLSSSSDAAPKEIVDPGELLPPDFTIGNFEMNPPGWSTFSETGIYNYMNGAAEIFLEFGFERGCAAEYEENGKHLAIELFKMKSTDAAYGIYTLSNYSSKIEEQKVTGLRINEKQNSRKTDLKADNYNLVRGVAIEFFKGNIYGRIAIDREDGFALMSFANRILASIPKAASRPKALSNLPVMDRIHGSERYATGIIGMNQILNLGRGDIWGLKSGTQIVAGEYRISSGSYYSTIVIEYRSDKIGVDRFNQLKGLFNDWEGYRPAVMSPVKGNPNVFLVRTPEKEYMGFRSLGDRIEIFFKMKSPNNFRMILEKYPRISVTHQSN